MRQFDQEPTISDQPEKSNFAMDEESGNNKVTGIWQIVRLKEFLQKWQSVTISSKTPTIDPDSETEQNPSGISPAINRRLKSTHISMDSDEDCICHSTERSEPPPDVPKGYLAVYVGPELRRFVIPTNYLSHSLFKVLLEKVEEEFGFDQEGGLTIPCEIETFKYLLKCMESHQEEDHAEDSTAGDEE